MRNSILLFILFGFISCETLIGEVSPDRLPKISEKLVVNSFISPQDTLVRVVVTASSPIFTPAKSVFQSFTVINGDTTFYNLDAFISNATVTLSNGEKTIDLSYNPTEKWYEFRPSSNTMRIENGKEYFLNINHENSIAKASTIVPQRQDGLVQVISKIEENVFSFRNQDDQLSLLLSAKVTFDLDQANPTYYRVRGEVESVLEDVLYEEGKEPEFYFRNGFRRIRFNNQGIVNGFDLGIGRSTTVTGSTNISNPNYRIGNEFFSSTKFPEIKSLYTELMTINEPYYLYYKSIVDFRNGNPFVEPTPIYTNIEGGLGVFAASNRKGQRVFYKDNLPIF